MTTVQKLLFLADHATTPAEADTCVNIAYNRVLNAVKGAQPQAQAQPQPQPQPQAQAQPVFPIKSCGNGSPKFYSALAKAYHKFYEGNPTTNANIIAPAKAHYHGSFTSDFALDDLEGWRTVSRDAASLVKKLRNAACKDDVKPRFSPCATAHFMYAIPNRAFFETLDISELATDLNTFDAAERGKLSDWDFTLKFWNKIYTKRADDAN